MRSWSPRRPLFAGLDFALLRVEDWLALAAVAWLPWAFGGVEVWAYQTAALLLVAAAAWVLARDGAAGLGFGRGATWLLPALLLGAWGAVQVIPLPPGALRAISPAADAIYRETFPGYPGPAPADVVTALEARALERVPEVAGLPGPDRVEGFFGSTPAGRWSGWRTLSLVPRAGVDRIFWYFALLAGFLVVWRSQADPDVAEIWRNALFVTFVALAVYGLVYAATANGRLFWVREPREQVHPFGPFVNPTNFAAVMELAVPWLAGYAWVVARRMGGTWRSSLRVPIFGAGAVLCLVAGLAAASKAAALLLAASLSVLALLAARGWRRRLAVALGALLVWGAAAGVLRFTPLGERAQRFVETAAGAENVDRWIVVQAALPIVGDFPVAGTGFGSFREIFDRYQPRGEYLVWRQLHNDYMQVLVEGGIVAGVLLLWLAAAFWLRLWRSARGPAAGGVDFELAGMVLGLASMSVHALVDFNHQIPGAAILFVAVAAVALGQAERAAAEGRAGAPGAGRR